MKESNVKRISSVLADAGRQPPFSADGDIAVLADELVEWLDDDRQWVSAYGSQWVSLIDDLQGAREACGPSMRRYLDGAFTWIELQACRKILKDRSSHPASPALRRRLRRVADELAAKLADPAALHAAWEDLIGCREYAHASEAARRYRGLVERQGHDPKGLFQRQQGVLADGLGAIRLARGESAQGAGPRERAGLTPQQRTELASTVLPKEPRRGHAVVWLKYSLAAIGPDSLEIGNVLTFYRQGYLAEELSNRSVVSPSLPHELHGKTEFEGVEHLCTPSDAEKGVPQVVVRVSLGEVPVADSLRLAQEAAELIVSLATLHGIDPSIWVLAKDYVTFVDGLESRSSMHAPDITGVTLDQQNAIAADLMPEVFESWGSRLEPHLPVLSNDLRRAAQLALWLRRTRQTWGPGRLVLCDRVFEQVAGWAGVIDRRAFIRDYLRDLWALQRVRMEIYNTWIQVASIHSRLSGAISEDAWQEITAHPSLEYESAGQGWRINLRGVLRQLDFIRSKVEPGTALHERISLLQNRTKRGSKTAEWTSELLADFDVLAGRAWRQRNSLIHGGPLSEGSARSVIGFVDSLAAEALHTAIEGFLDNEDLVDCFLDRRAVEQHCLAALRRNERPSDVLFSSDD